MMHARKLAVVAALALLASGCHDYLTGPGVGSDPNDINKLTRPGPLYIGIQAAQAVQFQSQLAREAAMYTQQVAGIGRQQIGFDRYTIDPSQNGTDAYWTSVYGSSRNVNGGGGLLDIRKMQQLARVVGDSLYVGIGKVYEALVMGMAADIWGDIPYRQAADSTNETPAFDPQLQVYADLQTQLDSAITIYLPASGPSNLGPPQDNSELIYKGRDAPTLRATYLQVAHSLKARLYMHTAEVDPTSYAKALAEVPLGISDPANDFNWFADATPNGNNIWWQFQSDRGDLGPGAAMIQLRRIPAGGDDRASGCTGNRPRQRDPRSGVRRSEILGLQLHQPGHRSRGLPAAGGDVRRDPAHRRGGGVPDRRRGRGAAVPGRGPGQARLRRPRDGAQRVPAAAVGARDARQHHGGKVRGALPEHRGLERLQADLSPSAGPGTAPQQHHAGD